MWHWVFWVLRIYLGKDIGIKKIIDRFEVRYWVIIFIIVILLFAFLARRSVQSYSILIWIVSSSYILCIFLVWCSVLCFSPFCTVAGDVFVNDNERRGATRSSSTIRRRKCPELVRGHFFKSYEVELRWNFTTEFFNMKAHNS